ncbi:cytochrome oxidase assembly protein ShyY1 [Arenicella xantha]|uniref:SURF1-like protein n=2 Tax=Arenicella xantha TaxID=644221 RepID=A0A395JN50_9GAMM|nr:cytochrome oxidase assembly protein ShyY1 [Arenicella xantha]
MLILAVVLILAMLRLGIWQLDRAEQKRDMLSSLISKSQRVAVPLASVNRNDANLRYTSVTASGRFLPEKTVLVDRQVVAGQVGYTVVTPFEVEGMSDAVLVARGWVSAGQSRAVLPTVETPVETLTLTGRLNFPAAQPPLWDDKYPVSDGLVWQYLPLTEVAQEMTLSLFPLVLELAPDTVGPAALRIDWPAIDDQWVAKHQGYAFQWFAMAFAFFIACVVLLLRRRNATDNDDS